MIVAGTGHRPEDCEDESIVRRKIKNKLNHTPKINTVISGMAAGFDLWLADEARILGLEVWAARPWATHPARDEDAELYERILQYASREIIVVESDTFPGNWCYHKRNEWMVDNSDVVMAYWNGKEKGGTFACRNYAKKVEKPVANIYCDPPF